MIDCSVLYHRKEQKTKQGIPGKRTLFTQTQYFSRRDPEFSLELPAEIIYRIEAAQIADLLDGIYFFREHFAGGLKPVLNKQFYWRTVHKFLKTASGFAPAYISCVCNIFQGDLFLIMRINKIQHFLQPYLIDQPDPEE